VIVIHIGFPKTATTTLQTTFMEAEGVAYLGKGPRDSLAPSLSLEIARAVFFADTLRFREAAPELRRRIEAEHASAGRLLLSDEAFTFAEHMAIGSRWQRQVVSDHEVVAERLAALCPEARIAVTLRNQLDLIRSFYRQAAKRGRADEPFRDYVQREIDALPHRSMLHLAKYDEVHRAYAARFGDGSLHVATFESARKDFAAYLRAICALLDMPAEPVIRVWGGRRENPARDYRAAPLTGRLQRTIPAGLRRAVPDRLRAGAREALDAAFAAPIDKGEYDPGHEAALTELFARHNRAFERATGLDLRALGYP